MGVCRNRMRLASAAVIVVLAALIGAPAARSQTITTVAGNGIAGFSGEGGIATAASLNHPRGVAFDSSGNVYIADVLNNRVRLVSAAGTITTFAGNGFPGFAGDGGAAVSAQLNQPEDVAVDGAGTVYIADSGNQRVRRVAGGVISTIAGTGAFGFNGDGIAAVSAQLNRPTGLAFDVSGNLYIADASNHRVRRVTPGGIITTVAGNGVAGYTNGPATSASLRFPLGVSLDNSGRLFIGDAGNHVVRVVTGSSISTFAGNGAGAGTDTGSFSGDGGFAISAGLNTPEDIAVDTSGNVYIADTANNRVRKVTVSGIITTIAGTGLDGFSGDGGAATQAKLNLPWGLSLDATGNLMIGDMQNERIRKIAVGIPGVNGGGTGPSGGGGGTGTPAVSSGGTVNGANFAKAGDPNGPVTAGTIVAVFGSNLTNGASCVPPTCSATFGSDGRLSTTMAGAQVTINGTPVPMFYATPGQLGVQIPTELGVATSATIQVTVGGQTSAGQTISLAPASPGIFSVSQDGKGAGAITHADLAGTVVSAQNPAHPGEVLIIYATGLGQVSPFVPTGMRPISETRTLAQATVTIDGIAVIPDFAGMSGCCVGLNQINVRIPTNTRFGTDISVFVSISGKQSNLVTIAVQP